MELFVGSVQVVVGQAEAHHHAGNFQHVLEIGDDGNRAAGADEDRIFLKDLVQRLGRGLDERIVGAHHARRAFAEDLDVGLDALGRELLHELGVFLEDVVRVLIGHQAHGDFGEARAGITVLAPGAVKPPGMPWTSSVGRAQVR